MRFHCNENTFSLLNCHISACFSKTSQRNKQIAMGRKKFNMDPKKVPRCEVSCPVISYCHPSVTDMTRPVSLQGIQFLLENDLLQHTPEDIAQFLYKGEGLNKTVIGDYLGER